MEFFKYETDFLFALFSGVKATYLLAVAFLEILRFSCNGGILSATSTLNKSNSAFSCVSENLLTPNLTPAVSQCLTAVVHRAFETVLSWMVQLTLHQFFEDISHVFFCPFIMVFSYVVL